MYTYLQTFSVCSTYPYDESERDPGVARSVRQGSDRDRHEATGLAAMLMQPSVHGGMPNRLKRVPLNGEANSGTP